MGTPNIRARFALALLVAVVVVLVRSPAARPAGLFRDFEAFYCAGEAVRTGADPYRAEPLGGCERRPKPAPIIAGTPGLAMPAPLPPYALLPFAVLSLLPFVPAVAMWLVFLTFCIALSMYAVHRTTGLPLTGVALALGLSDGYASLCLGQIAPVAVAAIAVGAWLLAAGRDRSAACVAACAMIEPHIGLPLCAALFTFRARTRLPLVALACAFAAASIASTGASTTVEYARGVLPAHALSEVANEKQYSLTYALHRLGIADDVALRFGDAWYLAMLALGIITAGRIARRTSAAAFAVVPPALVVFGGPFVHIVQIAAAVPAALFLYAYASARMRRTTGAAIVALAVPWVQFANLGFVFYPLSAIVVHLAMLAFVTKRATIAALAACATLALFAVAALLVVPIADPIARLVAAYDPKALAEASWALYVRSIGDANALPFDLLKLPTIAALIVLVWSTLLEARAARSLSSAHLAIGGKEAASLRRTSNG